MVVVRNEVANQLVKRGLDINLGASRNIAQPTVPTVPSEVPRALGRLEYGGVGRRGVELVYDVHRARLLHAYKQYDASILNALQQASGVVQIAGNTALNLERVAEDSERFAAHLYWLAGDLHEKTQLNIRSALNHWIQDVSIKERVLLNTREKVEPVEIKMLEYLRSYAYRYAHQLSDIEAIKKLKRTKKYQLKFKQELAGLRQFSNIPNPTSPRALIINGLPKPKPFAYRGEPEKFVEMRHLVGNAEVEFNIEITKLLSSTTEKIDYLLIAQQLRALAIIVKDTARKRYEMAGNIYKSGLDMKNAKRLWKRAEEIAR